MTKHELLVEKIAEKMYWLQYGEGFVAVLHEKNKEIWRIWAEIILDLIKKEN